MPSQRAHPAERHLQRIGEAVEQFLVEELPRQDRHCNDALALLERQPRDLDELRAALCIASTNAWHSLLARLASLTQTYRRGGHHFIRLRPGHHYQRAERA